MAQLTEPQFSDVRKLEAKWKGVTLLAHEKPPELASISNEQLKKLQKLEQELGVDLLAYK